ERAAVGQRGIGFLKQRTFFVHAPVVQDVSHAQYVRARERIGEEVARQEAQPVGESCLSDVFVEERLDLGQIEPTTGDVLVGAGDSHRYAALRTADVDERLVALPWE